MDHEVVSRRSEIVIGCLTRPGSTSVYTKERNVIAAMEFEVPK